MSRLFWHAYGAVAAAVILGMMAIAAGPMIEGRFWPVLASQTIAIVERTSARLCWAWTFTKLRDVASPDLDAAIEINGEAGGVVSVFGMDTGRPWGMTRFAVPARTAPYTTRMCTALPPYVEAGDSVWIRQTPFYPGWLGLWRLWVPFPEVVSTGAKEM